MEQTIGEGVQNQSETEVVRDHTGARHVVPVYDSEKAYQEAKALRPEVPWVDWNSTIRGGREWTG